MRGIYVVKSDNPKLQESRSAERCEVSYRRACVTLVKLALIKLCIF